MKTIHSVQAGVLALGLMMGFALATSSASHAEATTGESPAISSACPAGTDVKARSGSGSVPAQVRGQPEGTGVGITEEQKTQKQER